MSEPELFSSEELEGRFTDLFELAERFQIDFEKEHGVTLNLNVARLYLTVISTYDDITRYKFYHLSNPYEERSDAIKRAAYLTKWLTTRFKPWNVMREGPIEDMAAISQDGTDLVNEFFAVSIAVANLNLHSHKDFFLEDAKHYELIYDLVYRNLTDDALMLFYKTLVDLATGEPVILTE
jgi:hypothetical protein